MKFIETIKIVNGIASNIELHTERAIETILHHFGVKRKLPFELLIPDGFKKKIGVFKLRVIYSIEIESFTIEPYKPKRTRSLKLVDGGDIDYSYKYEDRSEIEKLLLQRENCDDILIVKNGFITDTSYTNILFSEGSQLYTPSTYLLNGVKRQQMLRDRIIAEKPLKVEDLNKTSGIYLINSMIELTNVCRYAVR